MDARELRALQRRKKRAVPATIDHPGATAKAESADDPVHTHDVSAVAGTERGNSGASLHLGLLIAGVLLWILLSLRVFLYAHVPEAFHHARFKLLLAPLVLWTAWLAMERLHSLPDGAWWVMGTLLVVAVADSAAFFVGSLLGRVKLAPHISPGKTVEGLLGGLFGVAVYALIAHLFLPFSQLPLWAWLALSLAVTLFSVIGDLHESLLKREAGVKDSGALLPGHGGVFDRVDSLLAAAPIMVFGLVLMGVGGLV